METNAITGSSADKAEVIPPAPPEQSAAPAPQVQVDKIYLAQDGTWYRSAKEYREWNGLE